MSIGRDFPLRPQSKRSVDRRSVALVSAALLASAVLAPLPGAAAPHDGHGPAVAPRHGSRPLTVAAASHQIAVLNHEAEIASEQMNTLRVRLSSARQQLRTLRADVARSHARLDVLRSDVVGTAVTQYQGGAGLSTTVSFLVAKDPKQFLTRLASDAVTADQEAGLLTSLSQQQGRLGLQEQQAQRELAAIAADRAALAHHQDQLDGKTRQAEQVLAALRKQQQERLARRQARQERRAVARASRNAERVSATSPAPASPPTTPSPPPPAPVGSAAVSGRAQIAVSYALAQVGDPYVYGAAGPDAFDCSGLTMAAWAAAGVSIPHSASMQSAAGTPVSVSALMPGDLVFYYSPISHVAMYIGNGQVVHAPHTGSVVQVVPLNSMPIAMAVRIG
jgi:cell wall-associated NlpC family hydrolase